MFSGVRSADPEADLPQGVKRASQSRDQAAETTGTSGRAVQQYKRVRPNAGKRSHTDDEPPLLWPERSLLVPASLICCSSRLTVMSDTPSVSPICCWDNRGRERRTVLVISV